MFIQNDECPWNVPVPVVPGPFTALFREHDRLNVRVDPAGVGAFGCEATRRPDGSLLFADLQTNLNAHIAGRLGSGRSGFFENCYLKGVGRTPLAANWNRPDHLHNTGHLPASAAIREYVVSAYLKALGCEDSVVCCEGLLFAELDPNLRDLHRLLYADAPPERIPAVDGCLQAISVKPGNFARLSNFVWLLHHLTPGGVSRGTSLATLTQLLTSALTPPGEPVKDLSDVDTATLAAMLSASVTRACEHFHCWFAKGVWWGSFSNNFTVDGRFLDLETPSIFGGPFFGVLSEGSENVLRPGAFGSGIIGADLLAYLMQMRTFCTELVRALSELPLSFSPIEREFAAELARETDRELLHPEGLIGSRAEGINATRKIIEGELGPFRADVRSQLTRMLELEYEDCFGHQEPDRGGCGRIEKANACFRRVSGLPFMRTEPGIHWAPFALAPGHPEPLCPSPQQQRSGRIVNEIVDDLDATVSLDQLLDKLLQVPDLMRQAVSR